jgi:hypothetical protein
MNIPVLWRKTKEKRRVKKEKIAFLHRMWYIINEAAIMKKKMLFAAFFCFLALIIPETSLFADIGLGGRIDAGIDMFIFPSITTVDEGFSIMPVIPLIDAGFYGQSTFGLLNLGAGIRGFSIIYINVFMPSLYAELNIWRFSLNAQVGGGALYLFPIWLMAGPYFVPELSMWFNITTLGSKTEQLRIGMGAITLLSPQIAKEEGIRDLSNISNNVIFYVALKAVMLSPWITWKRDL